MTSDLNLLYSGGSGGFVLLYFLLLSDQYSVVFKNNKSFLEAFEQQWQITNSDQWKNTESWPDNAATHQLTTDKSKIYYYCNPDLICPPDLGTYCRFNLALYVDYASQLELAYYKKAWIYSKVPRCSRDPKFTAIREFVNNWRNHYENIKDSTWPEYVPIKKIHSLSTHIKNELLQNSYTQNFLDYRYQVPTIDFNGQQVYDLFFPYLDSANVVIKLQDFINSRGQNVVDLLELPAVNDQQLELINHWCKLHPVELLERIGINT